MSDNKLINIYAYLNLITGKYVYTGQTTLSLKQRANKDGKGYKACPYFWNEIQKYGWNSFQGVILTTTTNKEYANVLEWFYTIELDTQYPNGCNSDIGHKRSKEIKKRLSKAHMGKRFSEETKKKMSEAQKRLYTNGYISPRKGAHCLEETRERLSESHKGYHHSEDSKRKIGEAHKGKHYSEEIKRKMSEAKKGKPSRIKGSHWYTNGIENRRAFKCPFGFYLGKTIKRKV